VATGLRRAMRELALGRAEKARPLLERAALLAPSEPGVRSYLALALARSGGDLHAAAGHARYAVEQRPADPAFLFNLAEVYAAAGLGARSFARVLGVARPSDRAGAGYPGL